MTAGRAPSSGKIPARLVRVMCRLGRGREGRRVRLDPGAGWNECDNEMIELQRE